MKNTNNSFSIVSIDIYSKKLDSYAQKELIPKKCIHQKFENNNFVIEVLYRGILKKNITNQKITIGSESDLDNRGLFLEFDEENVSLSTDWLGCVPIFYNEKDLIVSTSFNNVVKENMLDELGTAVFLKYGYSAFNITPFKNIKFLDANNTINLSKNKIHIIERDEKFLTLIKDESSSVENVIALTEKKLEENCITDKLIIPLSGGYDSRMISLQCNNLQSKKEIISPTYGYSLKQNFSNEVKIARKVSSKINSLFKHVQLTNDHTEDDIDFWLNSQGCSSHLHGMYHNEFYKKILQDFGNDAMVVSGVVGDAFSGKHRIKPILNIDEYQSLFLTHGLNCSIETKLSKQIFEIEEHFFNKEKEKLKTESSRLISFIRKKMVLLSYLYDIPMYYGYKTYGPYTDIEIVCSMLNLNESDKKNRSWQNKFFKKYEVDFKDSISPISRSNTFYLDAYKKTSFKKIESNIFSKVVDSQDIKKLNIFLSKKLNIGYYLELFVNVFKLNKLSFIKKIFIEKYRIKLFDYYNLYPINWLYNKVKSK